MGVARAQTSVVGQGSAIVIPGSTTFDDATSDYLSRTPSTSGNRRTFTRSYWIKLNLADTDYDTNVITGGGSDGNNRYHNGWNSNGEFYKYERIGGSDKLECTSNYRFNDYSGWYHILEVTDTTDGTSSNRYKLYVNGIQRDISFSTSYSQDQETLTNHTVANTIGARYDASNDELCANMCEHYFLDGKAADPTEFGYTDLLTGVWRPKKYDIVNKKSSPNNVITWSGDGDNTNINGSYPWTKAFDGIVDGSYSNGAGATDGAGWARWTPSGGVVVNTSLRVNTDNGSTSAVKVKFSGETVQHLTSLTDGWNSVSGTGTLEYIEIYNSGTTWSYLCGVEVDGFVLLDGAADNSFYLPLDGTGYSAFQTIGNMVQDQSGNQNNHTSNGSPTFQTDSPSGVALSVDNNAGITTTGVPTNYCILNAIKRNAATNNGGVHLTKGNLRWYSDTQWAGIMGTVGANTGKWYYEVTHAGGTAGHGNAVQIGVAQEDHNLANDVPAGGSTVHRKGTGWISTTGAINSAGGHDGFGTWGDGDTVGCAFDIDEKKIWFHKNGTWILSRGGTNPASGSIGDPALGTHPIFDPSSESSYAMGSDDECNLLPMIACQRGIGDANFGQKPFAYAPPKGFKPWCTANIPQPVAVRPDKYFGVVKYTGDGNSPRSFTGLGFKPDFIWYKETTEDRDHQLYDTVRGVGPAKNICSNTTYAQASNDDTSYGYTSSFDIDGWTVTNGSSGGNENIYTNKSGQGYVCWAWKAGGNKNTFNIDDIGYSTAAAAGLDGGSITPTGASVGTKQGFSIIKYVGNATGGASFSHGLSKAPKIIFHKNLDSTKDWYTITTAIDGSGDYLYLNQTNSINNSSVTVPTSSLVYMTASHESNTSGDNYIAYMWHDVEGLQKIGSYTGNGAKNFVYLGFRPARVMVKRVTANSSPDSSNSYTSWTIMDSARLSYNGKTPNHLFANHVDGEGVRGNGSGTSGLTDMTMEPVSNGFYLNGPGSEVNANTGTYIYLAWAEAPFQNLYGAQSNAR